jgi:hypothetical protein
VEPGGTIVRIVEKVRWLLSQKQTGVFIVLLAIIARIIQQVYFFNTRSDMTWQVLGMQHLLEGHGISRAVPNPADIAEIIYQPLNQWPPGFSLLLAPFYLLFGKNYIAAALALGVVFSLLLIFITRAILKQTGVPYHFINLFTLVTGFFNYYFYTIPCTDAVGISFLITAIYFALRILKSEVGLIKNVFLLCLLLIASGFIKYLFIPALFLIPAIIFFNGMMNKISYLKKAGLFSFISLVIVFGSFFVWQQTGSGTIGYIREAKRGFYPENLQALFPFVTGAFIRPETITQALPGKEGVLKNLFLASQLLTVLCFIGLSFLFLKSFLRNNLKNLSAADNFAWLSFAVSAAVILLLVYLSVRVGKESFDFGKWTYVQEPRYYGAIIIFIHLAVFILYAQQKRMSPTKKIAIASLLFIFWIPELTRGVTFTANRVIKAGKETYGWQQELGYQKKADIIVQKIKTQYPENKIILAGTSDWMVLRVSLYSHLPAFTNTDLLLEPLEIKSTKPAILLAMIAEDKKNIYKSFISLAAAKEEDAADGFVFYSLPVNPQSNY